MNQDFTLSENLKGFYDGIQHDVLRALFEHWQNLRNENGVMVRSTLVPENIPKLLPYLFIMGVEKNPTRFQYRLIGSHIEASTGDYMTGKYLDEYRKGQALRHLTDLFSVPADLHVPARSSSTLEGESNTRAIFHRIILPMSNDGFKVDQLLGGWVMETTHYTPSRETKALIASSEIRTNPLIVAPSTLKAAE